MFVLASSLTAHVMYSVRSYFILVLCTVIHICGLVLFLCAFFPLKPVIRQKSTAADRRFTLIDRCNDSSSNVTNSDCYLAPTFDRLIIILIDALRADFVLPNVEEGSGLQSNCQGLKMNDTCHRILDQCTVSFQAVADPPTVTMPRIKALTTGTVPGFIDVVLNFDTTSLHDDNIISQLDGAGKRIVFYGDDTWMKMFPGVFRRSDGTSSFFVTDYTQVDINVTRHITAELERDDWDVLILHYLGLDHIGHLAGPRSPLVHPKLHEMDAIVKSVVDAAQVHDVGCRRDGGLPTLIVLCGDHGMSDHGSHGGSTPSETTTPLVLLSSMFSSTGRQRGVVYNGQKVRQVDIVPTLSLLLGLPIPASSVGVLMHDALSHMSMVDQLKAAYVNAVQLQRVAKLASTTDNGDVTLDAVMNQHRQWLNDNASEAALNAGAEKIFHRYMREMRRLSDVIRSSLTTYDLHAMITAIIGLCVGVCLLMTSERHVTWSSWWCVMLGVTWVFTLIVHMTLCTAPSSSSRSRVCGRGNSMVLVMLAMVFASLCTLGVMAVSAIVVSLPSVGHRMFASPLSLQMMVKCSLYVGSMLAVISLLSSSFVEEEHQTWYFLTTTVWIILAVVSLQIGLPNITRCAPNDNPSNNSSSPLQCRGPVLACVSVLLLCRLARSWNQTGDKWAHLPDVSDWLIVTENRQYLSVLSAVCLTVVTCIVTQTVRSRVVNVVFTVGAVFIYSHRSATGAFSLPHVYDTDTSGSAVSQGVTEARVVYVLAACLFIHACLKRWYRKSTGGSTSNRLAECGATLRHVYCAWLLVTLVLARPHNIAVLTFIVLQQTCCQYVIRQLTILAPSTISTTTITLLYTFMGHPAFFYQGNSNSLATVDIAAGYVGLSEYSAVLIGVLMCIGTYAGPVLWWLHLQCLLTDLHNTSLTRYREALVCSCWTVVTLRSVTVVVYVVLVTVQRYHLFVWTVFSPKLLYESAMSAVVCALVLISATAGILTTHRQLLEHQHAS